jgi:F0F1-type ATP synthase assembly protein I
MSIRVGTPAKPVEILLVQLLRTMSTDCLLYINAGNLTGLRGVIGVLNVVIPQHYTGIRVHKHQDYTSREEINRKFSKDNNSENNNNNNNNNNNARADYLQRMTGY